MSGSDIIIPMGADNPCQHERDSGVPIEAAGGSADLQNTDPAACDPDYRPADIEALKKELRFWKERAAEWEGKAVICQGELDEVRHERMYLRLMLDIAHEELDDLKMPWWARFMRRVMLWIHSMGNRTDDQ